MVAWETNNAIKGEITKKIIFQFFVYSNKKYKFKETKHKLFFNELLK